MKTLSKFMALVMLCTLTMMSCTTKNEPSGGSSSNGSETENPSNPSDPSDPENPSGNLEDPTKNPATPELTADEQKEYLEDAGAKVINTFNPKNQKPVVELADGLWRKYEDYNWSATEDQLEEYFDGRYANLFNLPRRLAMISAGEAAPSANDIIVFSFNNDAVNFTVDEASRTIVVSRSTNGACTATFKDEKGTVCTLKVWGEGATKQYGYTFNTYNGTKTIKADVPAKTSLSFKQGSNELIAYSVELDAVKNNHINVIQNAKVTNITWLYDVRVASTKGSMVFEFKYGNKTIISAGINLPKYALIDKQDNQDWAEWLNQYGERYDYLLRQIGAGSAMINVMNLVQVKASVASGAKAYTDFLAWDKRDGRWSKDGIQQLCDVFNKNGQAKLHFSSMTEQAEFRLQPREYTWRNYNEYTGSYEEYTDYDLDYVLYFPKDKSSYAVLDFFTYNNFSALLSAMQDLANSYIALDTEFGLRPLSFF